MFLIIPVLWKSFYVKKSFRIHIFLKKPQIPYPLNRILWDVPCCICLLMADSIYLDFLWRGRRAGWGFGCAAWFLESDVNQPTKMGNQSNWWSVYVGGECHIIFWHCKEYKPHAEVCLNALMKYLLTRKWDPFMPSFSTTTADSGIPNWGKKK